MLIAPKRLKLRTLHLTHVRVPRDSSDLTPKIFPKGDVFNNLLSGDMHSHERLLVIIVIIIVKKGNPQRDDKLGVRPAGHTISPM